MNLRDWLRIYKVEQLTLAEETGYSLPSVRLYLNFRQQIPLKFAKEVQIFTSGDLKAEDVVEWSKRGIEERRKLDQTYPTPKKMKEKIQKIVECICEKCRKKLTKEGLVTKKE